MRKLIQRSITGAIYVILLIAAVICGAELFALVFGALLVLAVIELRNLSNTGDSKIARTPLFIDLAGSLLMFSASFLYFYKSEWQINPAILYLPYPIVRLIAQLYLKKENAIKSLSTSFLSQLVVALPFSLLNAIYFAYGNERIFLAILIFIWINDTGAYCVGSLAGKHRLFERISPKKSWEGFWGGLAFTTLSGIIIGHYFPGYFAGLTLLQWIGLAISVSLFSTWGDLVESLLKRTAGIKDSSHILPGHGGILDRIDSLLLVSPSILLYLYIIQL